MRALVLASLFAVVGCHRESQQPAPGAPPSTAEADALWKLAPDGAVFGMVASPRALAMVEHGWKDIHDFIATAPELAPAAQEMTAGIQKLVGGPDLTFASLGLSTAKGGAIFVLGKGEGVAIVPLGDRDKFLAMAKGKKGDKLDTIDGAVCKTTQGVYACGNTEALLDRLGKGNLVDGLAAAHARGDLEIVAHDLPLPLPIKLAIVGQLERGAFTLRGTVAGLPKQILARFGSPSKPRTDDHTTGFALAHVKPMLEASGFANADGAIDGVTPAQVLAALKDPITMTSQTDPPGIDARVPFSDIAPMKKLLPHCGDGPFAGMGAKLENGVCKIPVPSMGTFDVWIEGNDLRLGTKAASAGAKVAMSPLGSELANGEWQVAMWGRGSIFAPMPPEVAQQLQAVPIPDMAQIMVRVVTTMTEVGLAIRTDGDAVAFVFGARTLWSNPDDVVAKVVAISPADILAGKGAETAKAIAAAAPQSPFAGDVKAGYTGMMTPMALIGVMAAVAIPAFLEYTKRSKQSETSRNLNRIAKSLKAYWGEHATFPVGDTALVPAEGCCGKPRGKCPPDPARWKDDKIWSALEVAIDEPTMYQYRYHSDGKSALVEAVGDVDCDGTAATYKLHVTIDNDMPHTEIEPPVSGTY